jgi:hypothetical protein
MNSMSSLIRSIEKSDRVLVTEYHGVLTVYLDCRLLLQTKSGTVIAFQTYGVASEHLAQRILIILGLDVKYSIAGGLLTEYRDGKPVRTYTPKELLCKKDASPLMSKQ